MEQAHRGRKRPMAHLEGDEVPRAVRRWRDHSPCIAPAPKTAPDSPVPLDPPPSFLNCAPHTHISGVQGMIESFESVDEDDASVRTMFPHPDSKDLGTAAPDTGTDYDQTGLYIVEDERFCLENLDPDVVDAIFVAATAEREEADNAILDPPFDAILNPPLDPCGSLMTTGIPSDDSTSPFEAAPDQSTDETEVQTVEAIVSRVLEIFPDADTNLLAAFLQDHLSAHGAADILEITLEHLMTDAEILEQIQPVQQVMCIDDKEVADQCGCCFEDVPTAHTVKCSQGHSFCATCISRYISRELAHRNTVFACMDIGECRVSLSFSVVRPHLSPHLIKLYEKCLQQTELEAANLDNLEDCPFCDWACVIEIPKEEAVWFSCGNQPDCGAISCRLCREKQHLWRTCAQAMEGDSMGTRIAMEEAMSEALMRKCPGCQTGTSRTQSTLPNSDSRCRIMQFHSLYQGRRGTCILFL